MAEEKRERRNAYLRIWRNRPEVKKRLAEQQKLYRSRRSPEQIEHDRIMNREYQRRWREKHKEEQNHAAAET